MPYYTIHDSTGDITGTKPDRPDGVAIPMSNMPTGYSRIHSATHYIPVTDLYKFWFDGTDIVARSQAEIDLHEDDAGWREFRIARRVRFFTKFDPLWDLAVKDLDLTEKGRLANLRDQAKNIPQSSGGDLVFAYQQLDTLEGQL